MSLSTNRDFWNRKAKENAFWYVSSFVDYQDPDTAAFWQSGKNIWKDLKALLGYTPSKTDVAVDIGCGLGRMSQAIAPEVEKVHGVDLSEEMLARARQYLPQGIINVAFHHCEGDDLGELDDSIADLVFAYCVFQHLPSVRVLSRYLLEMCRVAKPGGLVVFTLSKRDWLTMLLPLFRLRGFLREWVRVSGPQGLWRKEWVGIRPSTKQVARISPIPLRHTILHGDKWLFFGRTSAT